MATEAISFSESFPLASLQLSSRAHKKFSFQAAPAIIYHIGSDLACAHAAPRLSHSHKLQSFNGKTISVGKI
jgi:hypothetical protein